MMRARRVVPQSLAGACVAVLLLMQPFVANAQTDASARALAVQLFDQAEALFSQGKVSDACPKYAESYRLDPQLGVLIYLAECYEKDGKLASAWGSYREAEEMARKRSDQRGEQARRAAAALEPRLSYIVVRVAETALVPGLEVLRNGIPVPQVLWGSRAAVDPGKQSIEARAPGYANWRTELSVTQAASAAEIRVPKLSRLAGKSDASSTDAVDASVTVDADRGGWQRMAAIAVGGLGIVGVGVGGFFGLSAQSALSDSEPLCNEANYCTVRGDELRGSAKSKALAATVATGVGAAALVTAAVLWFTAPSAEAASTKTAPPRPSTWAVSPARHAWGMELSGAF